MIMGLSMLPLGFLLQGGKLLSLGSVDLAIIVVYFAFVLGIGFYLKRHTHTGEQFFMAGREMTAWVAGLSFLAGILAAHWYWIGAIPAMLFLGIVMMPFYYISKTHSVPGYLQLRYGEGARALSAVTFGFMTVLMSGINMYSMALVMKVVLGLDIHLSIWVSSLTVAIYVVLGGLLSAIFNEVLQFALIWLGALLIPILGLWETGGWSGMVARISRNFGAANGQSYTHLWSTLGSFTDNPMGIHWTGIVLGLGWVISFGYWTTDFLVVQRVLSARDLRSAKFAPIIGAGFKMMVPFIVILPGLLGLALLPVPLGGEGRAVATVWTYDIYRPFVNRRATDAHYVTVGRWSTIVGVLVSIGTAYLVMQFLSIMDYVQALFSFFIAPLFGTVLLGMLWKRATPAGGFWGLLAGTLSSIAMWVWVRLDPGALAYIALSRNARDMAENMYRALWSWIICVAVTVLVSLMTKPKPEAELQGLVYGCTKIPSEGHLPLYKRPIF